MDKETKANQPTGMRELLTKWAELAPDEFSKDDLREISDDDLERNDVQAKIQYAVQAVIVERGWYVQIRYIPRYKQWLASVGFTYDVGGSNPAEAMLIAYLKELKENQ